MECLYPMLFEQNFLETVWGGKRLKPMKGLQPDEKPIGESWEVSAVPGKESIVGNGPFTGRLLTDIVSEYGPLLLGNKSVETYGAKFPLLIKLIDAAQDLSIQVHPDDKLARERHDSMGKTEMWYVVDAEEGSRLYSGFKSQISKYEYEKRVEDGSICDVLHSSDVHKGDTFFIPAGRVHAICGGLLIAEVQESSDITYRIFDYNRPGLDGKPRQLHTELAKDAIDYTVYDSYKTDYENKVNKPVALAESPYFTVKVHNITRTFHRKLYKYDTFIVYMCLKGNMRIDVCSSKGFNGEMPKVKSVRLHEGHSCLIPASCADINLVPDNPNGTSQLLEVYIDNKNINK